MTLASLPAARAVVSALIPVIVCALAYACEAGARSGVPEAPQFVSPLGPTYFSLPDTLDTLPAADSVMAASPGDIEAVLEAAAARGALWRYREAIALYDSAIAIEADDWRPWRFRGHRHISLREFDDAVRDLEEATRLESLSFDVAYHLGLARYLQGEWDLAADAYARCMDLAADSAALALNASAEVPAGFRACMDMATVDNDRVAMTEWRWRALRRAGRMAEADSLLGDIHADMDVGTNASYHRLLLLHKGERTMDVVFDTTRFTGNQFETVGYGVAVHRLTAGDTAGALDIMRRIVQRGDRWQAFGFIAAEQDLLRLDDPGMR
jgi:tetratricopeptide (TPR) repeat protein